MKLVIVTNLFPSVKEPNRSTFNFQQFTELSKLCELKVVAPIPLFQYSREQVPLVEKIGEIDVFHPRYLVIPKMLRCTYGLAFFFGIWHTLKTIYASFKYDVILAAWAYPDAFGTALVARLMGKKFFAMVLGSDINLAHQYWLRPAMIRWSLSQAKRVITVSRPLKEKIMAMGITFEKIVVIQNGVNKEIFYPQDKAECRQTLGLKIGKRYIVYIGNLVAVKGVEYLIRAFAKLYADQPSSLLIDLVIIGDGALRKSLEGLVQELGIKNRVLFKGRRPHDEIPTWLNAADVFCLPSLNEGCPNVILEALACGKPAVASRVGGIPELIISKDAGVLVEPQDTQALARGLKEALVKNWDATKIRSYAERFSWKDSAVALQKVLQSI